MNIGTPAQQVFVQLDTGSFELWVNPNCTGLSLSDATFCSATGSYVPSKSTTAVTSTVKKTLAYGIGSADIIYVKDSIALPGAATPMTNVQFGVATTSVDEFSGILGIGYGQGLTTTYPNFVDQLSLQNQTTVKAFSVGLGSKTEQEGAIVFGGVDTSKFAGKLATLPIIPAADSPDGVPRYWVSMNNMSLTPPNGVTKTYANTSIDVFFDTGATLTLLPQALADAIGKDFGASAAGSDGYYTVDCALNDIAGTVNFAFDGVTIKVPYNEFIRETTSGDQTTCVLGITGSSSFTLLGDTFLRSAYGMSDMLSPFDLPTLFADHILSRVRPGQQPDPHAAVQQLWLDPCRCEQRLTVLRPRRHVYLWSGQNEYGLRHRNAHRVGHCAGYWSIDSYYHCGYTCQHRRCHHDRWWFRVELSLFCQLHHH